MRESDEPAGSVRLQRWGNDIPLAIEGALAHADPRVHAWVASFAKGGVGELCGLWCSPRVRGFGLGVRLTRMGIALAAQARTNTLFGLCDTRNVEANLRLGFAVDRTLAANGTLEYPRPGLLAHVLRLDAAHDRLPGATPEARAAIARYRDASVGVDIIEGGRHRLELTWDLGLAEQRWARASHGGNMSDPAIGAGDADGGYRPRVFRLGDRDGRLAWEEWKRAQGDRVRFADTLRDQIAGLIKCRNPKTSFTRHALDEELVRHRRGRPADETGVGSTTRGGRRPCDSWRRTTSSSFGPAATVTRSPMTSSGSCATRRSASSVCPSAGRSP